MTCCWTACVILYGKAKAMGNINLAKQLSEQLPADIIDFIKKAGDIAIAGFDLSPATIAAIKGGFTGLVIDQQEWLQGYLPILQICLTKVYGFSGLAINTGAGFVDKSNVEFVAPLAEKNIR